MPASKGAPPPDPDTTDLAKEAPADAAGAFVVPGAYEYTAEFATVYLAVPLTARPAESSRPATVFAWPNGAPTDGRWAPTSKTPNQAADNAGPSSTEE